MDLDGYKNSFEGTVRTPTITPGHGNRPQIKHYELRAAARFHQNPTAVGARRVQPLHKPIHGCPGIAKLHISHNFVGECKVNDLGCDLGIDLS